jgi:hypothetical protein
MKSSRSRVRHLWSIAPKATHSNAAPFANQRHHREDSMLHSPLVGMLIGALIIAPAAEACTRIHSTHPADCSHNV